MQSAMLEAHIQFELRRFDEAQLRTTLERELGFWVARFFELRVDELLPPGRLLSWLDRHMVETPITGELAEFVTESVVAAVELLQDEHTQLSALVKREQVDAAVELAAELGALRNALVHRIVSSAVYSKLISNVLYQGIKGFLLTENSLAKNIPGASSLVKLGQSALSAASPQMEKNIDKQLIAFINNNIQETINDSERFLDTALDAEMLQRLGDELWAADAQTEVATVAGYFDAHSVRSAAALVVGWWADFRKTEVFHDLLESVVRGFQLRYGKQPVAILFRDAGVTEETVLGDLVLFAQPIAAVAIRSGALEAHIRQQLTAFYAEYTGNQG